MTPLPSSIPEQQPQQSQQAQQESHLPSSLLWAYQLRRENVHLATQLATLQSSLTSARETTDFLQRTVTGLERQVEKLGAENRGLREEVGKIKEKLSGQIEEARSVALRMLEEGSLKVQRRMEDWMAKERQVVNELRAEHAESVERMEDKIREAVMMEVRHLLDEERLERQRAERLRDGQGSAQPVQKGVAQQKYRADAQSSSEVQVPDSLQSTDTIFRAFEGLAHAPRQTSRAASELPKNESSRRACHAGLGQADAGATHDILRNGRGRMGGEAEGEANGGLGGARPEAHQPRPKQRHRRHIPIVPLDEEDELLLAQRFHHVESLDEAY